MQPSELLKLIREDLEDDNLKIIFGRLKQAVLTESDKYDEYVKLQGRFKRANKSYDHGNLSYENYQVEAARITDAVLSFVKNLKPEEIGDNAEPDLEPISEPILVICFTKEDQQLLKVFFKRLSFENTKICLYPDIEAPQNYNIIVFDNHRLPSKRPEQLSDEEKQIIADRIAYMKGFLQEDVVLVHYGEYLS
ncbi:MAG: hypothetical protein AAFU64_16850, partial [Bacteroidota bacterium]